MSSTLRAGLGPAPTPRTFARRGTGTMPPFDPQTITVPGCVDGWEALIARFGSKSMPEVLAPAIRLASDGFPASFELVGSADSSPRIAPQQTVRPGLYIRKGAPGDR